VDSGYPEPFHHRIRKLHQPVRLAAVGRRPAGWRG
jgi:hypothetical protein